MNIDPQTGGAFTFKLSVRFSRMIPRRKIFPCLQYRPSGAIRVVRDAKPAMVAGRSQIIFSSTRGTDGVENLMAL
jgi:hypothetical protein